MDVINSGICYAGMDGIYLAPISLQNTAQGLLKLGHIELALGYAVAALRLEPTSLKAAYRAAQACFKLQQYGAACWFLLLVRSCIPA